MTYLEFKIEERKFWEMAYAGAGCAHEHGEMGHEVYFSEVQHDYR